MRNTERVSTLSHSIRQVKNLNYRGSANDTQREKDFQLGRDWIEFRAAWKWIEINESSRETSAWEPDTFEERWTFPVVERDPSCLNWFGEDSSQFRPELLKVRIKLIDYGKLSPSYDTRHRWLEIYIYIYTHRESRSFLWIVEPISYEYRVVWKNEFSLKAMSAFMIIFWPHSWHGLKIRLAWN